ncbi:MAG TPA: hypothetical protein VMW73_17180 [Spirochaetia bacterium]|nr:hypothetical protein [Spirochaetia bacterium]
MEDYRENRSESKRRIRQDIQSLQSKLRATKDSLQKRDLVDKISKLEQERLNVENLFLDLPDEPPDQAVPEQQFPILNHALKNYDTFVAKSREQNRDVLGLMLYLHYFSEEYLGFLSQRKLKLDVKYSMVRDTFYNLFSQIDRSMDTYRKESSRIGEGDYTKKYEEDILKRLVEMRQALFIEANKFFRRVRQFADDLLADLEGDPILCQNGDDFLSYSSIDRETELRGVTVQDALGKLYDMANEAVLYLDVPDFQR